MKRSPTSSLLLALGLCIVLLSGVQARGRKGQNIPDREGKVLSLFNVVTFENEGCTSNAKTGAGNNRNGTCYTASECTDKGGSHSGNCAAGFGVCCVFTVEDSGDDIHQNCSYIRNPGFPSTYSGSDTRFSHTINKCTCDVCYIRLDFEAFSLRGTSDTTEIDGGRCRDTFSVTSPSGQSVPTVCGQNSGKHMYIETGASCGDSVTIASTFSGDSTIRRWDIKVTQIECGNPMAPPQGCLEYMTETQGRLTSYNFEASGETHLADQRQKICFRNQGSSCCVQYTECDDDGAFNFGHDVVLPGAGTINSACTMDYIEATSFSPDCHPNSNSDGGVNRICGGIFTTWPGSLIPFEALCDCSPQLSLTFVTDGISEIAAMANTKNLNVHNKGLCLDYQLIGCQTY